MNQRFHFTNDIGDIIAAMAVVKQLGGGDVTIGNHPKRAERGWRSMKDGAFDALRPLLIKQPYITDMRWEDSAKGSDYDFTDWRDGGYHPRRSLAHAQAHHVGIFNLNTAPWIQAEPDARSNGRILVARSARYHNKSFPWYRVHQTYRKKILFIGLPDEHAQFKKLIRSNVDYLPTNDFLEIAGLIAGSKMIVCNQSSPGWVAMAMGHRIIQETFIRFQDSMIENKNALFIRNSSVRFPILK